MRTFFSEVTSSLCGGLAKGLVWSLKFRGEVQTEVRARHMVVMIKVTVCVRLYKGMENEQKVSIKFSLRHSDKRVCVCVCYTNWTSSSCACVHSSGLVKGLD